jgi:hypothetical protein
MYEQGERGEQQEAMKPLLKVGYYCHMIMWAFEPKSIGLLIQELRGKCTLLLHLSTTNSSWTWPLDGIEVAAVPHANVPYTLRIRDRPTWLCGLDRETDEGIPILIKYCAVKTFEGGDVYLC